MSVNGVYNFGSCTPYKFLEISSKKSILKSISEIKALKMVQNRFDPDVYNFKDWIKKITGDKKYRMELILRMGKGSLKPKILLGLIFLLRSRVRIFINSE